jgi:hypothetical protein
MKSGYGVMTADKKLIARRRRVTKKALALLKATNRDKEWKVTVTGTMKDKRPRGRHHRGAVGGDVRSRERRRPLETLGPGLRGLRRQRPGAARSE